MLTLFLDRLSTVPLYEQIYKHIRAEITGGSIVAGTRMPSKRELARHLQTSPVTVESAYAQLVAEGYLESVLRSGHFVLASPETSLLRQPAVVEVVESTTTPKPLFDLTTGGVDPALFPYTAWAKLARAVLAGPERDLLNAIHPQGSYELRKAISTHLADYRGIAADPAQIVVGAGSEYLTGLIVQLLGRDNGYAVEDPGYPKIVRILAANGARTVRIPIDRAGINVASLRRTKAAFVHVTPSHQFPTGVVMPIGRRRELLAWAAEGTGRYIIEDDYDSEFRFSGQPIPALQGLDAGGRVIYMNSFTKSLAPSLRISYMVLPPGLLLRYRDELGHYACTVSNFEQATLARFMNEGRFDRHLARLRNVYKERRDHLIAALLGSPLGAIIEIASADAGLHFLLKVANGMKEHELVTSALSAGIRLAGLSAYGNVEHAGAFYDMLVIGYAGIAVDRIETAVGLLSALWAR
ncbi:MAG: PLP-dependent aminotransferase family protein [bacterium]